MESLLHMNNDWVIVCSQSLNHYVHCICGHRVKRITYLYHKPSKAIQYVGKTCVRKYGIEFSLTNPILLDVIKANLHKAEWDRDICVREHIQTQYTTFMTMAKEVSNDISVNTVVGPFRRLLSDVCDLVSEYGFDLVDILRDIEQEVESLNQTTRHQMVDEYSLCDTISEIASEHSVDFEDIPSDTDLMEENTVVHPNSLVQLNSVIDEVDEESLIEKEVVKDIITNMISTVQKNNLYNQRFDPSGSSNVPCEVLKGLNENINTIKNIPCCTMYYCTMSYCCCKMKYQIRSLHERIDELRINIKTTREEAYELLTKTRELRIKARECLDKSIYTLTDL